MSRTPDFVPIDPIPEDIIDTLRRESLEENGLTEYPNRIARTFQRTRVARGLVRLAQIVEPVDRTLGVDATQPTARAFHVGSLIGLRVASACTQSVDRAFAGIALVPGAEIDDTSDTLHIRQLIANEIIKTGDEGFDRYNHLFGTLLEDWEDVLVPEIRHQRFLRSGFGMSMAYLSARHAMNPAADVAALEVQIQAAERDGIDWDALLS